MKVNQLKSLPPLERLLYWITERESIRLKKEAGEPKPWTTDPILQSFRFCNVRRADDKVSRWLQDNWYTPNYGHRNMLVACALARFINQPATLEIVGYPKTWNPERVKAKLLKLRDAGTTIYNAAYMIRGNDGINKVESVVSHYVDPFAQKPITEWVDPTSMEETWGRVVESYGVGSFMAGQIVADLRWAYPGTWADARTWAPMGPGSKRGINRLNRRDKNAPLNQKQFLPELQRLIEIIDKRLPEVAARLEAQDAQNACCEFDKFERVLWGEGRPKQKYPGV